MLGPEELERYGRQLVLPEVGELGQLKLKAAKVLLIGAGGLGAPASLYLAAAGVGRLGLVDFDSVDLSNLQRQVLFSTIDAGRPKLEAARERLLALNPRIEISLHEARLCAANGLEILKGYDVVLDGTDNFPARYLINDACVMLGLPNVHGSIQRFEGRVSVFWAGRGPCWRCLYPEPPAPGSVPSCAEAGVLGVLPGIIGSLQALEAIKLLLGIGKPLIGRFVAFDGLSMEWHEFKAQADPACPVCGKSPVIRSLKDCEGYCVPAPRITPRELKVRLDRGEEIVLLDVREPWEVAVCALSGARNIPMDQLAERAAELDPGRELVVYCKAGVRSERAAALLRGKGFGKCVSLVGGIQAWAEQVDPSVPRY